ncbi:hypothetical protein U1Q18_042722 [Sarracenia purpurea var. burkii]
MDNKTWLWRRRSLEKTINANTKPDFSSKGNEEEVLPTEKEVSLERSLEHLNLTLASVLCESNGKDELLARHAKAAEDAIVDREKAEAAAVSLKQELDEALQQKASSNERLAQLNAALKDSMQQLTSVREEQEQRIRDAVMRTAGEFEKAQKKLEEKLTEKSKRVANLTVDNTRLSKTLLVKEKLIEELSKGKSQAEAEFDTLMTRLDSVEKENSFLKYEFRMLEKELEIRNEEIAFSRQSAGVSQKQHLESVKKITKLEAECQRLRILVRKRLPGPAALAKMKSEVEVLGRNQSELRRRKLNPLTGSLVVRQKTLENPCDVPSKKISILIGRLCDLEEENKALKEIIAKKDNENSKLSKVEAQLGELSLGPNSIEFSRCSPSSKEFSPTPSFDFTNDETSHYEPWASPREHNTFGVLDMSLMDDFVEMEKLAIVTVGTALGSSSVSSDASNALAISSCVSSVATDALAISFEDSGGDHLDERGKELIPVVQGQSSDNEQEIQTKDVLTQEGHDWLQNVLKLILDQTRISKRSFDDLLEDIRIAFTNMKHSYANKANKEEMSNHHIQSNMSSSICKIIELIRRIDLTCSKNSDVSDNERILIRAFQWKNSELSTVLQQFVQTCDDLLDGKAKFDNFASELTSALDWIINHCIICEDFSSVNDQINKHLGLDKSPSAIELEDGVDGPIVEMEKKTRSDLQEENRGLKDKLQKIESLQKDLEAMLRTANTKSEVLMNQLQESVQSIGCLHMELKTMKESKGIVEEQIESQRLINEDLDTQLTIAKAKLNEVLQKLSSLEVELEDKGHCCEELEATCLELQLQLESANNNEVPEDKIDKEERLLQTGWEITTASAKLAECQETIFKLGKQLKALALPREAPTFNKVSITGAATINAQKLSIRSTLLDRMLAEDDDETEGPKSPRTREPTTAMEAKKPSSPSEAYLGSRAIVASKKRGGGLGFLRKLLMRRKRGSSKKTTRSFVA